MELDKIFKSLDAKIKETKKITGFNSKHFAFRNWHATVMQLLRELPSSYNTYILEFKKLTFENTGFKRGRKFLSSSDNSRYLEDINSSIRILKEIIKKGGTEVRKPAKPEAKESESKKPVKKTGTGKAKQTKGPRKPAKTGSSSTRKKKKS